MTTVWEIPRRLWRTDNVQFYPRPVSLSSASPYTGARSIYGPTASVWVAQLTSVELAEADWRPLEAIFIGMQGVAGLVRIGPPLKSVPRYNRLNAGTPTCFSDDTDFSDGTAFIDGLIPALAFVDEAADAEADSIVIGGLPTGLFPALYAGDVFEVRPNGVAAEFGHLYCIIYDAPTDADGRTRVSIVPPLRAGVAVGDQIVLKNATSVFRPQDDSQGIFQLTRPAAHVGKIGFTLIEELP